jgi:DNA helicase-2/ATP-dependent DNA helicase PcrA
LENFQGIGPNTAKAIIAQAQTVGELKDIITQDFSAVLNKLSTRGWQDFCSLLASMLKTETQKPGELLEAIAESVYADYLKDKYENAEDRIEDIRQLAAFAGQQKSLTGFLSDISLDESYGDKNKDERDRLVLSTVHQAKGLEWEAVFLINLVAGAFPNERAMNEPGGEEEERRLFYVGITRAKSHLCLTYPMVSARFEYNRPSDFVTALKRDLVDHKEERNDWISQGEGETVEEPAIEVDKAGNRVKKRPKEFLKRIEDL